MKDQRFIELLNLYIDRQITAVETAELETEIQGNPKRQAVYQQYCKIHTATKLVYESFRSGATEQAPASIVPPATVELFESRRRRTPWAYYAGGLAAAACVALVFMRNATPAPAGSSLAAVPARPAMVARATPTATPAPIAPVSVASLPNPVSLRNSTNIPDYSAMLVALREQDEERALAGDRWQASRAASLFQDNLFEARQNASVADPRIQRARASSGQQAEFTAFQFQR